jgi:hypothetical protein
MFQHKQLIFLTYSYFITAPPRLQTLRNRDNSGGSAVSGSAIRAYALQLAIDRTTTFSQNIENFIQCTKEGKEDSPHVVMRNMRQFMSGMKNYLVSMCVMCSGLGGGGI